MEIGGKSIQIIEYGEKDYPEKLSLMKKAPKKLYIQGNKDLLKQNGIAVIGSRHCTEYGKRMTRKIVSQLVEHDILIISGMAVGIDGEAHKQTIEKGGKTIAVLPSGFEHIYPKEHEVLYQKIKEKGLVVSEYAPYVKPTSEQFIERNRIVSGLGIGTIVVEAGYRSGTSVTARITKEQGKPVFCIPSSLENPYGVGTNRLIQKGAILLTNIEQLWAYYPQLEKNRIRTTEKEDIQPEYQEIYQSLKKQPLHINQLIQKTKKSASEVQFIITMLELDGRLEELPGGYYKVKEQ